MLLTGEIIATRWEFGLYHLVQETAEGKTSAFETLFGLCVPHLTTFVLTKYHDKLDTYEIEAVVLEAMHRVWQKGGSCTATTDRQARNWILTIAKNLAVDLIRLKDRAREVELELDDERFPENKLIEDPEVPSIDLGYFYQRLTAQEQKVARLIASGYRDVDVAAELNITKTRVNQLKKQIGEKVKKFLT